MRFSRLLTCLSGALLPAAALAHELGHDHEHVTQHTAPLAEIFAGAALVLAAASLWLSIRTGRRLEAMSRAPGEIT